MVFYTDPLRYLLKEYSVPCTPDNPFKIASRHVQGRKPRLIFMIPIKPYLQEALFVPYFNDIVNVIPDNPVDIFDGGHAISSERGTGCNLNDHATGIFASSSSSLYALETDFSGYDTSEKFQNTRRYMLEGLREGYAHSYLGHKSIFGYKSAFESFYSVMEEKKLYYFGHNKAVYHLDQVYSGEFGTSLINTVNNICSAQSFFYGPFSRLKISNYFKYLKAFFLGDDHVAILEDHLKGSLKEKVAQYKLFVSNLSNNTLKNGLILNESKVIMRKSFYEYLKKNAIYGYYMPLYMQPLMNAAERPSFDQSSISIIRSLNGLASTMISRGWDHDYIMFLLYAMWNFKRTVRYDIDRQNRKVTWYVLPFGAIWTPISLGGVGVMPGSLLYPAKDGLIAMYSYIDTAFKKVIDAAAHILSIKEPGIARRLAKDLLTPSRTRPYGFFSKGTKFIQERVLIPDRVKASIAAANRLSALGIKPPHIRYYNMPNDLIETALQSDKSLKMIAVAAKMNNGAGYYARSKISNSVSRIDSLYGWMSYIKIKVGKVVDYSIDASPISPQCPKLTKLMMVLGHNKEAHLQNASPERLLRRIKADKYFPRYIQPETIMAIVSQPAILYFPERITDVLLTMGLDAKIASQVVNDIVKNEQTFRILTEASLLSTYDPTMAEMDLSQNQADKRLINYVPMNDTIVDNVLRSLGIALAIYLYMISKDGKLRQVTIYLDDAGTQKMMEKFTGSKHQYAGLKYMGVYPKI